MQSLKNSHCSISFERLKKEMAEMGSEIFLLTVILEKIFVSEGIINVVP